MKPIDQEEILEQEEIPAQEEAHEIPPEVMELEVEPEEEREIPPEEMIAETIREQSREVRLMRIEEFYAEPYSLAVEVVQEALNKFETEAVYGDIQRIPGAKTLYLYSTTHIRENYAMMLARVEEKDMFKTIAETVRHESKTYPRTTNIKLFTVAPFNFKREEILDVIQELEKRPEYEDIKQVKASNGAICLYSEKYLTKARAAAMTEWDEVERFENP